MKISIIVPVYGVEEFLEPCVASILANDCTDCEILLVDDGSPDRCGAICDSLAQAHPGRIRVIHQQNQGLGGARNTGLRAARGEYLLFVDSDDTIVPHALATLKAAMAQTPAEVYAFDFFSADGQGNRWPGNANLGPVGKVLRLEEQPQVLWSMPNAWTRLWKKELFDRTGVEFPSRVWYEDIRTTAKLLALAESVVILPDRLYVYLQRPGSIMNNKTLARNREILEAFDDLCSWYRQQGLLDSYRDALCGLAVQHVLLAASVRVARADPKHPLLQEFRIYMDTHFPDYRRVVPELKLSRLKRLALYLVERGRFRTLKLLFQLKEMGGA